MAKGLDLRPYVMERIIPSICLISACGAGETVRFGESVLRKSTISTADEDTGCDITGVGGVNTGYSQGGGLQMKALVGALYPT